MFDPIEIGSAFRDAAEDPDRRLPPEGQRPTRLRRIDERAARRARLQEADARPVRARARGLVHQLGAGARANAVAASGTARM
jgi:hypothetical protein